MADTIIKLSGSTDGKGVKVTGTSSAADVTVHTAHATALDFVTLYAVNQDADGETRTLTLAWGGETDPDNLISVPISAKVGPVMVCDRFPITNSLVVGAWADEADDVMVYGFVVRVT